MECRWQVEIDPYCQRVLNKHWPHVGKWDDVRTFPPAPAEDWHVDVICGGFPCQDISNAGECNGLGGSRSGLWSEFARTIREVRPRFVVVENVSALLVRGMGDVLKDLAAYGYDASWDCLPAAAFGARHLRDRVFIVGYSREIYDTNCESTWCFRGQTEAVRRWSKNIGIRRSIGWGPWAAESRVGRTAYGVPRSVDRKCLCGNAVVPQIAEWIGRRIIEAAGQQ